MGSPLTGRLGTLSAFLLAPAFVLAVLAIVIGLRRPIMLLVAYAAVIPYGSGISVPVGLPPAFGSMSTLLGLAASVGIVAHLSIARRRALRLLPALPVWAMFLGFAILTFSWSVAPDMTRSELLVLGSLVVLYAVTALLEVTPRDLRAVEHGIVLGGAVGAVWGIVLFARDGLGSAVEGIPRLELPAGGGEMGDPNIAAAILLLPLVVAVGRGIRARSGPLRVAYLSAAALTATALLLTGSRGGLVAAIVALVVLAVSDERRGALVGVAAAAVITAAIVFTMTPDVLQDRLQEVHSTGRTDIWRNGLAACPEHCLTGSGWGSFPEIHEERLLRDHDARGRLLRFEPHSIWVGTLVEGGVVALALLVTGLAVTAASLLRLRPQRRGPPLAGLVGLVITNSFLGNLAFKYFWLVLIYATMTVLAHGPGQERRTAAHDAPVEQVPMLASGGA